MDKERILKVADAIENATLAKEHGIGFNMSYICRKIYVNPNLDMTGYKCNTVACIAGWSSILYDLEKGLQINYYYHKAEKLIEDNAAEYLELNKEDSRNLFYPDIIAGLNKEYNEITDKDAVKVLRHLAETGKVDWSII